jgi:hypothetical protein
VVEVLLSLLRVKIKKPQYGFPADIEELLAICSG